VAIMDNISLTRKSKMLCSLIDTSKVKIIANISTGRLVIKSRFSKEVLIDFNKDFDLTQAANKINQEISNEEKKLLVAC
jgi:nitrogenase subunit NifH